jgi:hypothetical protein
VFACLKVFRNKKMGARALLSSMKWQAEMLLYGNLKIKIEKRGFSYSARFTGL